MRKTATGIGSPARSCFLTCCFNPAHGCLLYSQKLVRATTVNPFPLASPPFRIPALSPRSLLKSPVDCLNGAATSLPQSAGTHLWPPWGSTWEYVTELWLSPFGFYFRLNVRIARRGRLFSPVSTPSIHRSPGLNRTLIHTVNVRVRELPRHSKGDSPKMIEGASSFEESTRARGL